MSVNNEQSYDAVANDFACSKSTAEIPPKVQELSELLRAKAEILDIGSGSGRPIDKFLSDAGHRVLGIDVSEKLIEIARQNVPDASFMKVDVRDFNTQRQFDAVIAWDSLFHLQPDQQEPVFKRVGTFIKPAGYFLFTHGGREAEMEGEMYGHRFSYSSPDPEKIKKLLHAAGFRILSFDIDDSEANGYLICLAQKI